MATKRSFRAADVAGKRVLLRVDFNVPMSGGQITDDSRIRAVLPTIRTLLESDARVIAMSHLGRPKGAPDDRYRLAPVAAHLEHLLEQPVRATTDVVGDAVSAAIVDLQPGSLLLLENLRFEPGEEQNDPEFADQLASLGDVYVNDAFGAAHRAHASTVGVAERLPAYAGGLLLAEVEALSSITTEPARPFVAIVGGAKVSDKIGVLKQLLRTVDTLLVGGGMANTFLLAQNLELGKSLVEPDFTTHATALLDEAERLDKSVILPSDVIVASDLDQLGRAVAPNDIGEGVAVYDIGPETRARFAEIINSARTVFWNGPMGVSEHSEFAGGTAAVAEAVASCSGTTIIGGGDSVAAVGNLGLLDDISHVSTGGGASLEFLKGRVLPGLAAIPDHA